MELASPVDERSSVLSTTVGKPSRIVPSHARISAGDPDTSMLVERMRSRSPVMQMPPLGTQLVDDEAVRLMTEWIASDLGPERPRLAIVEERR